MPHRLVSITVLALAACETTIPEPEVAYLPSSLNLPPSGWEDGDFEWRSVSVLNETFFQLTVTDVELRGTGSQFLELQEIPRGGLPLGIRDSVQIRVRVGSNTDVDLSLWDTRDYEATLNFEVGGSGRFDPTTGVPIEEAFRSEFISVPITFSLNCDLDGDGFDAESCGGGDCDDHQSLISPAAEEVCDGTDNNCALGIDEADACEALPG